MTTSNICIDIVLPVYNVAPYLNKCLTSIAQQSHPHFRAILVDDGSTDNSLALCQAFAEKDNRFVVISQTNQGVVQARLTGAKAGENEWITFIDPDDYVSPDYLRTLIEAQQAVDADFVIAQYYEVDANNPSSMSTVYRTEMGVYEGEALREFYKSRLLFSKDFLYTAVQLYICSKLLRRALAIEALEQTTGLTYGEDMVANLYAIRHINRLHIIEDPIYYYLLNREGQATKTTHIDRTLTRILQTWERMYALDIAGDLRLQQASIMWISLRSLMKEAAHSVSFSDFYRNFEPILKHPLYVDLIFKRIREVALTKADILRLTLLKLRLLRAYYFLHKTLLN